MIYTRFGCCFLTALFTAALAGCGSNSLGGGVSNPGGVGAGGTGGSGVIRDDAGIGGATATDTLLSAGGAGGAVPTSSSSCTFVDGGTPPAVDEVTGLGFSTVIGIPPQTGPPVSYPPPVHVVVTDAAKAQDAYAAILALPVPSPPPLGFYSCPLDFGVTYQLTFLLASGSSLEVSADPSGCQWVSIPGTCSRVTADAVHAATDFWSEISQDLGIPESEIYPYLPSASEPDGG